MTAALKPLLAAALLTAAGAGATAALAEEPRPPQWLAHLVHVHLEANGSATFLQRLSRHAQLIGSPLVAAEGYEDLCAAPCDTEVDPGQRFRIGGPDVNATELFAVPATDRPVSLRARVGSQAGFFAGALLTVLGGLMLPGATFGLAFSAVNQGDQAPTALAEVGIGVGLASVLIGLPLWIANGTQYSVAIDPLAPTAAPTTGLATR